MGATLQQKFLAARRRRAFSGLHIAFRGVLLWSIGLLLLFFFVGQSLGVVHAYSHARTEASTHCGACLVGTQAAEQPPALLGLTPPSAIRLRLLAEPAPAASRLLQRTPPARAPPA